MCRSAPTTPDTTRPALVQDFGGARRFLPHQSRTPKAHGGGCTCAHEHDALFRFQGDVLPELNYRLAVKTFGQHGAAELIYLVGFYCLVSVTLNGFDVPVPEPGT